MSQDDQSPAELLVDAGRALGQERARNETLRHRVRELESALRTAEQFMAGFADCDNPEDIPAALTAARIALGLPL